MLCIGLSKGIWAMSDLRKRFGKRLRQIRRHKDLTQEQLAEAVGITAEYLSNLERGVNAPSFETLEKLAEVLEVDVTELFGGADPGP
jgi:transcriptional regulator with XRE-family HTH domain